MLVRSDDLEEYVWGQTESLILKNPDTIIRAGQLIVDTYLEQCGDIEAERHRLNHEIGLLMVGRDNILALVKRGRLGLEESDAQLASVDAEIGELKKALEVVDGVHERVEAYKASVREMESFVRNLRYDPASPEDRRMIFENTIERVEIWTSGTGWQKSAAVTVRWRVLPPNVVGPFSTPRRTSRSASGW